MVHDGHRVLHRHIGRSGPRCVHRPRPRRWEEAGQTIQIVYDPAKPTSISPTGQDDPRWLEVAVMGLGAVVLLGMSVYFAYRAWLA